MTPNTFIIGAPKTGTSALAMYLSEHPEVFFSNPKEPFYWCFDFPKLKHELMINSLDDYLELFKNANPDKHKIIAEGSTRYLRSEVAVRNILEFCPGAKFIIMARNPVELVQAYHMEQRYSMHEDIASFEEAWALQEARSQGKALPKGCREPAFLQYREVAKLGEQIRRVYELAPPENIKVILIDDLKTDALRVYKDALEFLEIRYDGRTDFPVVNSSHGHRLEWLAKLVLTPPRPLEKTVLRIRKHLWEARYPLIENLKAKLNQKSPRNKISPELENRLYACFREDVTLLEKVIDRDLSAWKRTN